MPVRQGDLRRAAWPDAAAAVGRRRRRAGARRRVARDHGSRSDRARWRLRHAGHLPGAHRARSCNCCAPTAMAMPTAVREFLRTDRLLVRVPAYGARRASREVTARLLNRAARLHELSVAMDGQRRGRSKLPLAPLPSGEYLLEITAAGSGEVKELVALPHHGLTCVSPVCVLLVALAVAAAHAAAGFGAASRPRRRRRRADSRRTDRRRPDRRRFRGVRGRCPRHGDRRGQVRASRRDRCGGRSGAADSRRPPTSSRSGRRDGARLFAHLSSTSITSPPATGAARARDAS